MEVLRNENATLFADRFCDYEQVCERAGAVALAPREPEGPDWFLVELVTPAQEPRQPPRRADGQAVSKGARGAQS